MSIVSSQEILRYSKQKREGTAIVLEEPQSKQNNRQDFNQTGHGQVNQVIAHLNHDTDMEKHSFKHQQLFALKKLAQRAHKH